MDYQRVTETGLPILYFLGLLRLGSSFSARFEHDRVKPISRSCFYPSDRFSLEPTNRIELEMCSHERIPDREQHVNNHEKTVIKRYETLDFARFSNTSFNTYLYVLKYQIILKNNYLLWILTKKSCFQIAFMAHYLWIHQ